MRTGAVTIVMTVLPAIASPALAEDDLEAACVAAARSSGHLTPDKAHSAIAATDPRGRTFVRVTWSTRAARGEERWLAYRCTFGNGRMIDQGSEMPPITEAIRRLVAEALNPKRQ